MDGVQLRTPYDIQQLIQKGATVGLTPSEQRVLQGYAISSRGQEAPEVLAQIDQLTRQAPVDPTGLQPSTLPSVADQANAAQAAGLGGPAGIPDEVNPARMPRVEGGDTFDPIPEYVRTAIQAQTRPDNGSPTDALGALLSGAVNTINSIPDPVGALIGNPLDNPAVLPSLKSGGETEAWEEWKRRQTNPPPDTMADIPADILAGDPTGMGLAPSVADRVNAVGDHAQPEGTPTQQTTDPPIDNTQLERRNRRRAQRGKDPISPDAVNPSTLYPDLNMAAGQLLSGDAGAMARVVAQNLGGDEYMAMLIQPEVSRALAMMDTGVLGNRRGFGPSVAAADTAGRVKMATDWVQEAMGGTGREVNTQGLYQDTLRRLGRASPDDLMAGGANATEGLLNQVRTTKAALLNVVANDEDRGRLDDRLNSVARDWIATISAMEDPLAVSQLTFPKYLRDYGGKNLTTHAPRSRKRGDREETA